MTSFADPGSQQPSGDESRNVQVNLDANVSGYSQGVGQARQQTEQLNASVGKLSGSLSGLSKYAGKQLIHFAVADFAGITAGVADAASLERQLGTLRATSTVTGSSMEQMKTQLDGAFSNFPVARSQVIQLAETINNLGVTAPRAVGSMIGTFTKLGAATGENPISLASSSIQLDRQLGNTDPGQVAGYANSLLTVSKNQGVAASGVLDFAANIAPMARAAGIGEAAVLGISAAFTKAGADGAYAANAFNRITGDILNLSQTGSPEIAKYSNFVGKSAAEFKAQSGTAQITSVFDQIAKGGPQATNFEQSLGGSQREVKAIQAVAQGGGLSQAISVAQGSATNTDSLDAASKTAFAGLTNTVVNIGNEFTMLGEKIGAPLLTPITMLANGFDSGLKLVNKVVDAMGPLPSIVAGIAGALAIPAGLVLGHMGLIGGLALGRTVLGSKSAPRTALREGRAAGEAIFGGASQADAMAMSATGRRIAAGEDPNNPMARANLRQRIPFNYAMNAAAAGSSAFEQRYGTTVMGMAGRGVGRVRDAGLGAATWIMNDQTRGLKDSHTDGPERSGNQPRDPRTGFRETVREGSMRGFLRAGQSMVGESVNAAGSMAASGAQGLMRMGDPGMLRRGIATAGGAVAATGGALYRGVSAVGGALMSNPLAMMAGAVAIPAIGGLISSIKSKSDAVTDVGGSLTGASKYDQALDKSSSNLARFGQSVNDAANRLAGFANTPLKNLTTVTGQDVTASQSSDYKVSDEAFTTTIEKAKEQADQTGGSDAEKAASVKKAALAYLDTTGIQAGGIDGSTFTKYKQDLTHILGPDSKAQGTDIMSSFQQQIAAPGSLQATSNFSTLGTVAATTNQQGGSGGLESYKQLMGAATAGIRAGTQNAAGTAGGKSALAQMLSLGAAGVGGRDAGQNDRLQSYGADLNQMFGIDTGEFNTEVNTASKTLGTGTKFQYDGTEVSAPFGSNAAGGSEANGLPVLVKAFAATAKGKATMATLGIKNETELLTMAQHPGALPPVSDSVQNAQLAKNGDLGKYAAGNALFGRVSTGDLTGNASASFTAAQQLVGEAAKQTGGDMTQATANMMKLSDAVGGASVPMGALIKSSADLARQAQSFTLPTLSREGQLTQVDQTAAASAAAAALPNASTETTGQAHADQNAANTQHESYRQFMIGRIQQIQQFTTQQSRSIDDQTLQVTNSNRDFGISQDRSEQAYGLSRTRSIEDFGTQQVRAQEDYNTQRLRGQQDYQQQSQRSQQDYQLSVSRQNADHARDLARQSQAAAQSIYDPFIREQTKATTDAGTLIYNLTEQNRDIEKQMKQIGDLKKKGVSQQTIDTLNLTTSGNAQQVNTLDESLTQNPGMVKQINSLIGTRGSDTTKLTQNPDNVAFRQSEADYKQGQQRASEDFTKSMSRAAADYQKTTARQDQDFAKSQNRAGIDQAKTLSRMSQDFTITTDNAIADHQRGLDDMAKAFQLSQKRAVDDLATSLKQYTGGFDTIFSDLAKSATGSFSSYAPAAAKIMTTELNQIKRDNPWIAGIYPTDPLTSGGRPYQVAAPAATAGPPDTSGGAAATLMRDVAINNAATAAAAPTGSPRGVQSAFAFGGISLTEQVARVSEHGPELHLPLNSRGENFMAGLIAKSLAQGITTATSAPAIASNATSNNNSINFSGADIKILTQDPTDMARQLAAKAKLARLASPVRH